MSAAYRNSRKRVTLLGVGQDAGEAPVRWTMGQLAVLLDAVTSNIDRLLDMCSGRRRPLVPTGWRK